MEKGGGRTRDSGIRIVRGEQGSGTANGIDTRGKDILGTKIYQSPQKAFLNGILGGGCAKKQLHATETSEQ